MSFTPADRGPGRQPLVIALLAVSAVAVGALVLVALLATRPLAQPVSVRQNSVPVTASVHAYTYLKAAAAEEAVARIVDESYGERPVTEARCPANEPVRRGHRFDCTLVINGLNREVTVTFTDDDGTYEVSRPR